jgi:glycosyltransferase involved in cell wall biosynthesis
MLPLRWIIVSDGSTDGTDEIVLGYAADYPWIELLRMPERRERHFAGKVLAFNAGYKSTEDLDYEVLVNLDADVTFDSEYFAYLLQKLSEDTRLGLVGTRFEDPAISYDYRFVSIEHVSGACQVFRRQCFEQIGGYVLAKGGAIDRIANITCRMKSWKTRTFLGRYYKHHRAEGGAQAGRLRASFRDGAKDYAVGTHPVWMLFRVSYQMTKYPYIFGALALSLGYLWSYICRRDRPVSRELVNFNREEQMRRLRAMMTGQRLPSI